MAAVLRIWERLSEWVKVFRSQSSHSHLAEELSHFSRQLSLLSSLLQAGLTPRDALSYAQLDPQEIGGRDDRGPKALFLTFWRFGVTAGGSLTSVLTGLASACEDAAENTRQATAQMVGPRAATQLVMLLPVVALVGGELVGYHPISFLLGQPVGWVMLLLASVLIWGAHRWSNRLVSRAQYTSWAVGMPAVAMAAALRSGASLQQAQTFAQGIASSFVSEHTRAAEMQTLKEYEQLSLQTGVALSGLLESSARYSRSCSLMESRAHIDKLSVSLMVPLGVCVLPAFIAVGVIPMVFSVISSTSLI